MLGVEGMMPFVAGYSVMLKASAGGGGKGNSWE